MIHKLIKHALVISLAYNSLLLGANIVDSGLSKKTTIFRLAWGVWLFVVYLMCDHTHKGGNN